MSTIKRQIRIPKPPYRRKKPNRFDDTELPTDQDEFQFLHEHELGRVIRKTTKPAISEDDLDSEFCSVTFQPSDEEHLSRHLSIGPQTPPEIKDRLVRLIKQFWCCFAETNVKKHIRGYECVIDTGNSKPTVARNIRYGIHETPIMQKAIDGLLANNHITIDDESTWLSRIVLAPKPHQEGITDISDFIWRFCISFIALNQVTKVISYYIPRCDDAVEHGFGSATLFFLMDACSGYHQIKMEHTSSLKTAFAGPFGRKYRYLVMPFGVVNGPTIFVMMIYDLKDHWDEKARIKYRLTIDEDNNTTVIIDDTFGFVTSYDNGLTYLEAILTISRIHNLSWKLKKCSFFPDKVEFVGHDLTKHGNLPASSKDILLRNWTRPKTVREIASFVGFGNFYSRYIPYFESRVSLLRSLTHSGEYSRKITDEEWNSTVNDQFEDIREAILSKPLLRRIDRSKRCYLKTDFSAKGMGYVLLQPGDDEESLAAMHAEDAGGPCLFDITLSGLRLFPCGFGSRMCRGIEQYFHSFYGEASALKHGIHKNRHVLFGRPFTCIGDCIGLKWIMAYDGSNPAIRRLQMELMFWWFTMVHRPNRMLVDADYFSRLEKALHYDPLLAQYLQIAQTEFQTHPPAASDDEVKAENLPGFRRNGCKDAFPQVPDDELHSESPRTINTSQSPPKELTNIPVHFVQCPPTSIGSPIEPMISTAYQLLNQDWCIFRFSSGHFSSNCLTHRIPFRLVLAADPSFEGRSLFRSYSKIPTVLDSAMALLNHINSAPQCLQGYYINTPRIASGDTQREFLRMQCSIITAMRQHCHLQCFTLQYPIEFHNDHIQIFQDILRTTGWSISRDEISFTTMGDAIDGSTGIMIGIHVGVTGADELIDIPRPPLTPRFIEDFIYKPFDTIEFAMSLLPDPIDEESESYRIEQPTKAVSHHLKSRIEAHLIRKSHSPATLIGTNIMSRNHPAPELTEFNFNPFQELFGIFFHAESKQHTRMIAPYEYVCCWQLDDNLSVLLCKDRSKLQLLDKAIPAKTSKHILASIATFMQKFTHDTTEIFDSSNSAAPAATITSLISGVTQISLPTRNTWIKAYQQDPESSKLRSMLHDPSTIDKEHLDQVHFMYRQPLRDSRILEIDKMLYIREPADLVGNYIQLQIVPDSLQNIVFIAFHSNPIGGHFSQYHTLHRIRLRFYWPTMHKYVSRLVDTCAGCKLANARLRKSSTLVYSFPIDEPFKLVHADVYTIGSEQAFNGEKCFMNVLCGMTGFAVTEPIPVGSVNANGFARAIMKILLTYGICHTIVLDKDSKFRGTFADTMKLLHINSHTASGGNHDAVLTERYHVFVNKCLTIFCNERDSNRTVTEGVQLCCYAWNSAPVTGTDLSRSLLVTGREFRFPLEYTTSHLPNLNPSTASVENFAHDQATLLKHSAKIFRILIQEHRSMHREYINSNRPNPIIYEIGDRVLARRAVKSDKSKGRVGKVMYRHTGPWEVTAKLDGASYQLRHCRTKLLKKKHASHLSPLPTQLIPFAPLTGPDNSYGQLHKKIRHNPYAEAGIDGYQIPSPWSSHQEESPTNADTHESLTAFHTSILAQLVPPLDAFPTLAELNDELPPNFYPSHPPSDGTVVPPVLPLLLNLTLPNLIASIIQSLDKLFFIVYRDPHTDATEWKLVQINFVQTMKQHPNALTDGRFLVDFFVPHPNDVEYSAVNQRFWKEYHSLSGSSFINNNYHLIKPTPNTEAYCSQKNIVAFNKWITINDPTTFIHGPFDFASINGRKTRDRISSADWQQLTAHAAKYQNSPPNSNRLNIYSFHTQSQFHTIRSDPDMTNRMYAESFTQFFQSDA